jgi:AcrR family transcriptional regulator
MAVESAKRTRVTKAPEDRRRDLLDAGLSVLREKGADATVADVTEAAGVAKGTFYLYFASKDDLVAALRHRLDEAFVADVAAGFDLSEPEDWWRMADRTVERFVDFLLDIDDVHDVLYHGTPGTASGGGDRPDSIDTIAGFLRRGTEAGAFAVRDPEVTGALLFSALHGAVDIALARGEVDRDRIVSAGTELVHKALAP